MASSVTRIQLAIAAVALQRKYPINFFHSVSAVNSFSCLNTFVSVLLGNFGWGGGGCNVTEPSQVESVPALGQLALGTGVGQAG